MSYKQSEALQQADMIDQEFVRGRVSNSTGRVAAIILRSQDAEINRLLAEKNNCGAGAGCCAQAAEIDRLNEILRQIGDIAHDASTGPAVPDLLWEIRGIAYDGLGA